MLALAQAGKAANASFPLLLSPAEAAAAPLHHLSTPVMLILS